MGGGGLSLTNPLGFLTKSLKKGDDEKSHPLPILTITGSGKQLLFAFSEFNVGK